MQTTDVIVAIGTIVLAIVGIIAIFQDKIRAYFFRPKLEVVLNYAPPDCHKTKYVVSKQENTFIFPTLDSAPTNFDQSIFLTPEETKDVFLKREKIYLYPTSGSTGPYGALSPSTITEETDAYYFRLRISNIGNTRAELVEVFAVELSRKIVDGTYKPVDSFLPMNLVWSNIHELFFPSISPGTYKHCDIAHIINPEKRHIDQLEDHTWTNVSRDDTILSFDTIVKPYTKNYLVCPGTYRLQIIVAAANAKPIKKTLEITNSGQWFDEERQMLEEGISFRLL